MSLLENEGIECEIKNEIVNRMTPMYTLGDGGAKLQVSEENYVVAKNILTKAGYVVENDDSADKSFLPNDLLNHPTSTTTNWLKALLWVLLLVSALLFIFYSILH